MVEAIVRDNLARWQEQGLVPSMPIEPGDKTDEPIRTRGWTYWHHLFPARHLLIGAMIRERMLQFDASILLTGIAVGFCRALNLMSKLTRWRSFQRTGGLTGGLVDFSGDVFYNQALNTVVNYGSRSFVSLIDSLSPKIRHHPVVANAAVDPHPADETDRICDIWVTDPPYADAINYHEITEYFVGWLRKNPPITEWLWDTRRVLALKGRGDGFRKAWSRLTVRSRSTCPTMGCRLSCSPTRTPACGPTWRRSCGVPAYG
jgi:hypothetical protein